MSCQKGNNDFFFVDRHYYTGAEWFTSLGTYVWSNTTDKAHVFKETLPNATKGSCVALTNMGLQGAACSESLPFVCEKGLYWMKSLSCTSFCKDFLIVTFSIYKKESLCYLLAYCKFIGG